MGGYEATCLRDAGWAWRRLHLSAFFFGSASSSTSSSGNHLIDGSCYLEPVPLRIEFPQHAIGAYYLHLFTLSTLI